MSKQFKFVKTPISNLVRLERKIIVDDRGYLSRLYCAEDLKEVGINKSIAQINHTLTRKKGTIRGMHFQYPPHSETKIVTCIQGEVYDVAVDLRKNSKTFGKHFSIIITDKSDFSFFIPQGFAHGFFCLSDKCIVSYKASNYQNKKSEKTISWFDKNLKIKWPIKNPITSKKDALGLFVI